MSNTTTAPNSFYSKPGDVDAVSNGANTALSVGEMIAISSGLAVAVAGTGTYLDGIAEDKNPSFEGLSVTKITINVPDGKKVYQMTLASAALLTYGDEIAWASAGKIEKWVNGYKLGMVAENMGASGTSVFVRLYQKKDQG